MTRSAQPLTFQIDTPGMPGTYVLTTYYRPANIAAHAEMVFADWHNDCADNGETFSAAKMTVFDGLRIVHEI